jgi:hypothetical protein
MGMTTYFSESELETWSGLGADDFQVAGVVMNSTQWSAYYTLLEETVRKTINTFCRRESFLSATYTDYHDGKEASGDHRDYQERDRIFFLLQQPVISITSVSEDIASKTSPEDWTARTARSSEIGGDYELIAKGGFSYIRFHNNVPRAGVNNVKIVYVAGYADSSEVFDDIKGIALDMASKHLQRKKRLQEAAAARTSGTRDAADMVPIGDPKLLTNDIKERLQPYKRARAGGRFWR